MQSTDRRQTDAMNQGPIRIRRRSMRRGQQGRPEERWRKASQEKMALRRIREAEGRMGEHPVKIGEARKEHEDRRGAQGDGGDV